MIDCDVHISLPDLETLYPYLPEQWVDYGRESAFIGPDALDYPPGAPTTVRPDLRDHSYTKLTSDLSLLQQHALDPQQTDFAILSFTYWVQSIRSLDLAAALATALNRWQFDAWLERDPRLRGSILVPSQSPEMAAREIEHWAQREEFVQVLLPVRSEIPYGNRLYDPIYQAAVDHDQVIALHFGGAPGNPPTPTGWPSTYLEEYAGMAQVFQSQVMSLIFEGVFDRFPTLRVVLVEAGFTWMPSLMWRMDKEWKGLRHNVPWVKRPPSAYMREHLRLTLQPADAPPDPDHFAQIVAQMGSDEMLLFSSDYPHWHFDETTGPLPIGLTAGLEEAIMDANARSFYRL